jgi:LPS-assembly lipoprotein
MRIWIVAVALLLSACGFHLRGAYSLPFDTIYVALPESAELRAVIKRNIEASTQTRVTDAANEAQATLRIVSDAPIKNILSLNSAGRVREFQLTRTFVFAVANNAGGEYLPQSTIVISREMSFDDSAVLSKEAEEVLLWRDIQNDLVQQLLRRLAAAKLRPPATPAAK